MVEASNQLLFRRGVDCGSLDDGNAVVFVVVAEKCHGFVLVYRCCRQYGHVKGYHFGIVCRGGAEHDVREGNRAGMGVFCRHFDDLMITVFCRSILKFWINWSRGSVL